MKVNTRTYVIVAAVRANCFLCLHDHELAHHNTIYLAALTIIIGSLVTDHSIFWKKISNTRKFRKKIQALGDNQTYDPLTFSSDAYQ